MFHFKCCCRKELWGVEEVEDFAKEGPAFHTVQEIREEALNLEHFGEDSQLLSWLPLRYFQVISLSKVVGS